MRGRGLTVIEVLVALALFAVLASAAAGLQLSALRLTGRAAQTRAVTDVLAELAVPARARDPDWAPCRDWPAPPEPDACEVERGVCCPGAGGVDVVTLQLTPPGEAPLRLRLLARGAS